MFSALQCTGVSWVGAIQNFISSIHNFQFKISNCNLKCWLTDIWFLSLEMPYNTLQVGLRQQGRFGFELGNAWQHLTGWSWTAKKIWICNLIAIGVWFIHSRWSMLQIVFGMFKWPTQENHAPKISLGTTCCNLGKAQNWRNFHFLTKWRWKKI